MFSQTKFFYELIKSNEKLFRYDLIWDKVLVTGFLNANRQPLRRHEQIAIFYKKQPKYHPQMGTGQPLHGKGKIKISEKTKNNNVYGEFKYLEDTRLHPTEKPVSLLEYLIKTYTNEKDIVLDNCMGSGSTGIACLNTNRSFIGIELDKNTFEIAKNRILSYEESIK